jgi:peroxiredoxin
MSKQFITAIWVIALFLGASFGAMAQAPGKGLTALTEKKMAPDFELSDLDGKIHRMSDYRGKVVIVNFWATWCPPCREEMPSMQRAWEAIKDQGGEMLAIDVGEDEDRVFQFTADYPVEFPLLLDRDTEVPGRWGVRGLPTTYVVDKQGRMVYRAVGGREWDDPEILKLVRELLK